MKKKNIKVVPAKKKIVGGALHGNMPSFMLGVKFKKDSQSYLSVNGIIQLTNIKTVERLIKELTSVLLSHAEHLMIEKNIRS